jgi:hypothetical protein
MPVDGGIVALSGFLYQAYAAGGLVALTETLEDDGTDLAALVWLAKQGTIEHEVYDQDVVLRPMIDRCDQGLVFIQLKYSAAGMNAAYIAPAVMQNEVIASFIRSKKTPPPREKQWRVIGLSLTGE